MNIKYLFFLLAVMIGFSTANGQSLTKADKKYDLGYLSDALKLYEKSYESHPDNLASIEGVIKCYEGLNMFVKAVEFYKILDESTKLNDALLIKYGHALKSIKRYNEAIIVYNRVSDKSKLLAHHYISSTEYAAKNINQAEEATQITSFSTDMSDFSPAIYKDNVVFSSNRTDKKRTFNKLLSKPDKSLVQNQLFIFKDNTTSLLMSDLKNELNNAPLSFSADGKWVAFSKNNYRQGVRQNLSQENEQAIYIGEVNAFGEWENIKSFPFNVPEYSCTYPAFSENGEVLYYASNQPDGFGGFDIYMSHKVNGKWQTPLNMGRVINTLGNEIGPCVFDGDLYFASDWHYGFGGLDLFKARKNQNKIEVLNLGAQINSSKDDYDICINQSGTAFFTSNRKGTLGYEDILTFEIFMADKIPSSPMINNKKKSKDIKVVSNVNLESSDKDFIVNKETKKIGDSQKSKVKEVEPVQAQAIGYAIQLASYDYRNQVVDRSQFKSVAHIGNLYDRISGNKLKVKLGIFKTRSEADLNLEKVRALGFKEAFISTESNSGLMDKVLKSMNDKYVLKGKPKYGIRLAAYSKKATFEGYRKRLSNLGSVKLIKNGIWEIAYIIDIDTKGKAESILPRVKKMGFNGAYLVSMNEMGHYEKLE